MMILTLFQLCKSLFRANTSENQKEMGGTESYFVIGLVIVSHSFSWKGRFGESSQFRFARISASSGSMLWPQNALFSNHLGILLA